MGLTKDELIADLYAIRAGLSVISQEKDKADAVLQKINKEKEYKERIEKNQDDLWKKRRIQIGKEVQEENSDGSGFFIFLAAVVLLFSFIFFLADDVSSAWGVGLVIIAIILIANAVRIKKRIKKRNKDNDEKYMSQFRSNSNQISLANSSISKMAEEYKKILLECSQRAAKVEKVLQKNYAHILSQDDWGSVDLLIYYLSTGRADTLKEALQLYDRQSQTDEILRAIGEAQSNICSVVKNGFVALGTAMVQCFAVLSNQINAQHEETMKAVKNVGKQLSSQEKNIAALKDALTAKMNVNSKQLAADMNSLKNSINKVNNM